MAHESFEDAETAALMNANYINIKVDREERPDLDQIYQNVAQALTRSGGWPLTVFLLPDQRPFFGGTYFPPDDRWGRPGFPRVLKSLAEAYRDDRPSVLENAEKLTQIISELERNERKTDVAGSPVEPAVPEGESSLSFLREVREAVLRGVDWNQGGFGDAPKFPNSMMFSFLWRMGGETAMAATLLSLVKMAKGGIFDQLGGGFHRYSVDDRWAVPHFEKMLYDNALLLQLYSEVVLRDRAEIRAGRPSLLRPEFRALFIETVRKTTEYLLREMEDPDGGFYAAQDADSEGEEGKFFAFDLADLESILGKDSPAFHAFSARYGIDATGNFEHGKTVLWQAMTESEVAARVGESEDEIRELLRDAAAKVFAAREKRVRPGLDDKILVSWNGLAITGLVWAAHLLEWEGEIATQPELTALAERARGSAIKAFERIVNLPLRPESPLASDLPVTIQKNIPKGNGFLDDYAFLARSALDLARFGVKLSGARAPEEWAALWMGRVLDSFRDPSGDPGYFFTGDDHEKLLQRPKSLYDQAIPSGTAVTISNLIVLSELLEPGEKHSIETIAKFRDEAARSVARLIPHLEKNAFGHGELANALRLHAEGIRVFSGVRASAAVSSDRDFAPEFSNESSLFKGSLGEFKVCARGACRGYDTVEAWATAEDRASEPI